MKYTKTGEILNDMKEHHLDADKVSADGGAKHKRVPSKSKNASVIKESGGTWGNYDNSEHMTNQDHDGGAAATKRELAGKGKGK